MSIQKTVINTDLTIRIPTGDPTLAGYSALGIKYKTPNGDTGELGTVTVYSSSYLSAPLPRAVNIIAGEWFFWGHAITPTGEYRKTFSYRVRVKDEGEEE